MANCYYCEREFDAAQYGTNKPLAQTKDHVIPISRGGAKGSINMIDCCTECNHFKGDLFPEEFVIKTKDYFDNNKRFKTIPHTRLFLIAKNTEKLIESFVKVRGEKLYVNNPEKIYSASDDLIADGEFKVVIKKKSVSRKLKHLGADAHLSVNANTFHSYKFEEVAKQQAIERILYLQSQTVEQFRAARTLKEQLALPEPNFYYL